MRPDEMKMTAHYDRWVEMKTNVGRSMQMKADEGK